MSTNEMILELERVKKLEHQLRKLIYLMRHTPDSKVQKHIKQIRELRTQVDSYLDDVLKLCANAGALQVRGKGITHD